MGRDRDGRIMKGTPYYRVCLYIFNMLLCGLQITFMICAVFVLTAEKLVYFPFKLTDYSLAYLYAAVTVQLITCICGILAIYCSNRHMLRLYWVMMLAMIVGDLTIGVVWTIRFKKLHSTYSNYLKALWLNGMLNNNTTRAIEFCNNWDRIQTEHSCCGPTSLEDFYTNALVFRSACLQLNQTNQELPLSCCADKFGETADKERPQLCVKEYAHKIGCYLPLLKWIHGQADVLAIFGYWLIFALKVLFVVVLRQETREVFYEMFLHGSSEEFNHWTNDGTEQGKISLDRASESAAENSRKTTCTTDILCDLGEQQQPNASDQGEENQQYEGEYDTVRSFKQFMEAKPKMSTSERLLRRVSSTAESTTAAMEDGKKSVRFKIVRASVDNNNTNN